MEDTGNTIRFEDLPDRNRKGVDMELDRCKEIERSIIKRYRKSIWRPFIRGIQEYDLIQDGDKIAVCISGG